VKEVEAAIVKVPIVRSPHFESTAVFGTLLVIVVTLTLESTVTTATSPTEVLPEAPTVTESRGAVPVNVTAVFVGTTAVVVDDEFTVVVPDTLLTSIPVSTAAEEVWAMATPCVVSTHTLLVDMLLLTACTQMEHGVMQFVAQGARVPQGAEVQELQTAGAGVGEGLVHVVPTHVVQPVGAQVVPPVGSVD